MDEAIRSMDTKAPSARGEPRKLHYINWLRGAAILLVVIVHHAQNFASLRALQIVAAFGQMGVQLFFVASALTLCMSAHGRQAEPNGLINFYIRRVFRIAPLYWIGIALYSALAFFAARGGHGGADAAYTAPNIAANALFVHGFVPSAQNSVVPGGWSIATEMTFYAAFPFLLALYAAGARRHFLPTVLGLPVLALFLNLTLQVAAAGMTGVPLANNSFLYFSILNQLPVFFIGMSGYFLLDRGLVGQGMAWPVLAATAGAIACTMLIHNESPLGMALLPTVGGFGFFGLALLARQVRHSSSIVEHIGEVSYSMYVFHFLFAWWGTKFLLSRHWLGGVPLPALYIATLAGTIAAAYCAGRISKHWIEEPSIRAGSNLIRKLRPAIAATT